MDIRTGYQLGNIVTDISKTYFDPNKLRILKRLANTGQILKSVFVNLLGRLRFHDLPFFVRLFPQLKGYRRGGPTVAGAENPEFWRSDSHLRRANEPGFRQQIFDPSVGLT
jgi:hypothetical protein